MFFAIIGLFVAATAAFGEQVDVFLLAGQSNMVGRAKVADLSDTYRAPRDDVMFCSRVVRGAKPAAAATAASEQQGGGWGPLQPGTGALPRGEGFGPEVGFGHAMGDAVKAEGRGRRVAIVKYGRSGANLYDMFHPDATTGLKLYAGMIEFARQQVKALRDKGDEANVAGFVWYQGEADATGTAEQAAAFEANLKLLIARVRKDLGRPELPVVLVRVNPNLSRHVHRDVVRAAIPRVAEADAHAAWVDVDDLNEPDHLHLDAAGQIEAGKRMVRAWQAAAAGKGAAAAATRAIGGKD